jgi:dihydroorotase/N-acyl-D-amino-acid deacylase
MRLGRLSSLSARATWSCCCILLCASVPLLAQPEYDLVIRNGRVIDGTGSPWYRGDIGIRSGRIAGIGYIPPDARAVRVIDARDHVVAPGFIDMLGQSEMSILVNPHMPSKIYQGMTTEITGEGASAGPLTPALIETSRGLYEHYGIQPDWRTLGQYFARLERQGIGINLASYVGATQVRRIVLGDGDRQPSEAELNQMRALVREAMQEGAAGLSTSLQYAPAPYASTEELIALAREATAFGGIYATHMRSEGDAITEALDETIRIGREAKIPVEIWHLKAAGTKNWGRMPEIVRRIEQARRAGIDIAADTYAYPAWFNDLSAFIPPWAHDGGDGKMVERLKDPSTRQRIRQDMNAPSSRWDNEWLEIPGPEAILFCVTDNAKLMPLQGKTVAAIAKERHADAMDAIFNLLIEDPGPASPCSACPSPMSSSPRTTLGIDRQRFTGRRTRRHTRQGAPAPPRVRYVSTHSPQVRARRAQTQTRRGDPQVQRVAGPAHATGGPRGLEAGHVGGYRRV